jgi:hypothetical protein
VWGRLLPRSDTLRATAFSLNLPLIITYSFFSRNRHSRHTRHLFSTQIKSIVVCSLTDSHLSNANFLFTKTNSKNFLFYFTTTTTRIINFFATPLTKRDIIPSFSFNFSEIYPFKFFCCINLIFFFYYNSKKSCLYNYIHYQ